jgi:hypothetical protein
VRKQYHFWPGDQGLDAWDVDRLIRLAVNLPVVEVPLASISEIDSDYWFDETSRPTVRNVVEHARLMAQVDLSWPILLGHDGRVMDGMHRIGRALLDGAVTIRAKQFPVPIAPDHPNCRPQDLSYD